MPPKARKSLGRAAAARTEARSRSRTPCDKGVESPDTLVIESSEEDRPSSGSDELDMRNETQKMLEEIREDFKKFLQEKRKSTNMNISASVKTTQQKVEHLLKVQYEERKRVYQAYSQELESLVLTWNADAKKVKEQRDILADIIQQQIKASQEAHAVHCEHMKTFKALWDQYMKKTEDLEKHHERVLTGEHSEFRRQMAILQGRLMMNAEQEERENVRRNLLSLIP